MSSFAIFLSHKTQEHRMQLLLGGTGAFSHTDTNSSAQERAGDKVRGPAKVRHFPTALQSSGDVIRVLILPSNPLGRTLDLWTLSEQ